jgi:serine/threonine-protein kinase HipA
MVQINSADQIIHGSQALQDGYDHYIIKFPNSNDGIDSGKIEYIYSQMAQKAGVEIPKTKLLKGKKGSYFAIKRFDRVGDKRVHIHSVAGLVHSDFRLPSLDYDDLLKLTFHLTKNKNEVTKLYKLAVFNLLTHNRDDHAKNFSFLLDTNHNWKLAPAYDLTYSYGVGTEHSTTYLNEGKNPTETHLKELAKRHDIRDYKTIIDQTKEAVAEFGRLAKEIELPLAISSSLQKVLNRAD